MSNPVDMEGYYNKYLPAAQAIADADVHPFRLDSDLAIVNIETCMRVVAEHRAEIVVHFPRIDLAGLEALPEIALATKYAAQRVEQDVPAESDIMAKLSIARDLRAKLLSAAKSLAENELVPSAEVTVIAAGSGTRDRAEDCVALASLFRHHAQAIAGKHPISVATIDQAAEVGTWLMANLRPVNAPSDTHKSPSKTVEIRDRFVTMLVGRHHKLQVIAHYFHPTDWEDRAPALGSRKASKKKP